MSWGVTSSNLDKSDIFEEKIKGTKYLFKDKWLDLKLWEEVIKVKDGEAINHIVRYTHHGPVFDETNGFFNAKVKMIGNYSFAWSFLDPKVGSIVKEQISFT